MNSHEVQDKNFDKVIARTAAVLGGLATGVMVAEPFGLITGVVAGGLVGVAIDKQVPKLLDK